MSACKLAGLAPPCSSCREHAAHLRAVGSQVKRCCQGLAAVLRDNAPVAPAFEELRQLEVAFWQLQQGVGAAAAAAAHAHASGTEAAVEAAVEQLLARSGPGGGPGGDAAEAAAMHGLGAVRWPVSSADLSGRGSSQDSLSLHLSLSMLFTCCTRVRGGGARCSRGRGSWERGSGGPACACCAWRFFL